MLRLQFLKTVSLRLITATHTAEHAVPGFFLVWPTTPSYLFIPVETTVHY